MKQYTMNPRLFEYADFWESPNWISNGKIALRKGVIKNLDELLMIVARNDMKAFPFCKVREFADALVESQLCTDVEYVRTPYEYRYGKDEVGVKFTSGKDAVWVNLKYVKLFKLEKVYSNEDRQEIDALSLKDHTVLIMPMRTPL